MRVDVRILQVGEKQFCWRGIIALWCCENDRELQLFHMLLNFFVGVISGSIEENDGIFPPLALLGIQFRSQIREIDLHDVCVRVHLSERNIYLSDAIKSG